MGERPFTFSWLRNGRFHQTYAKIQAFQMTKQAARRDTGPQPVAVLHLSRIAPEQVN